ncbi:MAG: holo-ACP synthase [Acidobacteria bacterium]|nr:holo-ACP synthase [Acidobacteriota bacterium]
MIVGVGVDIIDIERLQGQWDSGNQRFFERVFTAGEIDYCARQHRPAVHFAARFAAKEALFKALGTGLVAPFSWQQLEVKRDATGQPRLDCRGALAEHLSEQGNVRIHLTMSHTRTSAAAVVLLELC